MDIYDQTLNGKLYIEPVQQYDDIYFQINISDMS